MPSLNPETRDVDIAIVGGGMVGLSLALSLAQALKKVTVPGCKIVLIDGQPEVERLEVMKAQAQPFSPRVSALTVASEELLSSLGVWQSITDIRACPYDKMYVWDGDGTGSISFSSAEVQEQRLGHIVENNLISAALNEAVNLEPSIEVLRGESVISLQQADDLHTEQACDNNCHILILKSGCSLNSKLVLAADGANSFIRTQANFKTKEWDYQHQAIVTTVKTEKPHNFTATQCFLPSGPLAFLPLLEADAGVSKEQHYSSIVWSCVPERAEELMAMDDDAFCQALGQAFEFTLGNIEQVDQRFTYPLRQRHAVDYVQSGIALLGDAAHTIHPLAGQGVNLGFLDVVALTQVLVEALAKEEDFSSQQTLSRYQRQRKGNNLGMMLAMEGFKRLFASNDLSLRWLRNMGISGVDSTPMIKNQLMKKAMGL